MMSTENAEQHEQELANRFRGILDRHGYGFQYAVIRKFDHLFHTRSSWLFEVAEFPVGTGRHDTRIDFIIRPRGTRFFVAVECKRANPALNNWCFVRAPYVMRNRTIEELLIEQVVLEFPDNDGALPLSVNAHVAARPMPGPVYHIGFEVKNQKEKGDPEGSAGRAAVEEAAGQAFKGINGLVNTLATLRRPTRWEARDGRKVITQFMPAIFTTAKLWSSDVDLGASNLATGNILQDLQLEERPWLIMQYPVSPALRHSFTTGALGFEFADMLQPLYLRSIAVVSVSGIEDFLSQMDPSEWMP